MIFHFKFLVELLYQREALFCCRGRTTEFFHWAPICASTIYDMLHALRVTYADASIFQELQSRLTDNVSIDFIYAAQNYQRCCSFTNHLVSQLSLPQFFGGILEQVQQVSDAALPVALLLALTAYY